MKQQHHPKDLKTYQKGINSDVSKDILGAKNEGEHVDALNMRSMSMDGNNLAKKKIKGEFLKYDAIDNRCSLSSPYSALSANYECMMTQEVNGYIVEAWASSSPSTEHPFMRINGLIVCQSADLPIYITHPLQYDKNENCVGGEFYITNNNTPPMVFSLKDLLINSNQSYDGTSGSCTTKYFDDFDIEAHTINVSATTFKPAFITQVSTSSATTGFDAVLGSSGLAVGSYSYCYRLVTADGERTTFSPITELIPVVRNVSSSHHTYPYRRTFSSKADITSPTSYGNHIRIKYLNESGFTFLEVRRDGWFGETPIGTAPTSEIIGSIPVTAGVNIVNLLDKAEPGYSGSTILTLEELSNEYSSIKRAKGIRYFNERLYLMNIGYEPKDVDAAMTFTDPTDPVIPTVENMGKPGHSLPYNAAMYKSNMRGERVGFGAVLFDKEGNASFTKKITDQTTHPGGFKFPKRRECMSTASQETSYKGAVKAASVHGVTASNNANNSLANTEIGYTHEVFDHYNGITKEATGGNLAIEFEQGESFNTLNPTSQNDTVDDLKYRHIASVGFGKDLVDAFGNPEYMNNSPAIYGLNYYSEGIAVKGVEVNDAVKENHDGFSIVQTEPAKRVLAQGLAFYALTSADVPSAGVGMSKSTDTIDVYFPDLELLYPDIAEDLVNNPSSYKIEFVSPLGYHTEPYSWYEHSSQSKGVDMITYVRGLRNGVVSGSLGLPGSAVTDSNPTFAWAGGSGLNNAADGKTYTGYGRWRNTEFNGFNGGSGALNLTTSTLLHESPMFVNNSNGGREDVVINSVEQRTTNSGRQSFFRINLNATSTGNYLYNETGASRFGNGRGKDAHQNSPNNTSTQDATSDDVRAFQEPMYVVNIFKDNTVNQGLTTQYKYTGNYIKFKSLIGSCSGTTGDTFRLVSERWEDCIPKISDQVAGFNGYDTLKRFVYVQELNSDKYKRWMNVTFESSSTVTTLLTNLAAAGTAGIDVTDSSGTYRIHGIYTSSESNADIHGASKNFDIIFNATAGYTAYTVPSSGSLVYVYYDKRIPVRVFGGETYVNENVWAVMDNEYKDNGQPQDDANTFKMDIPFPDRVFYPAQGFRTWQNATGSSHSYSSGGSANMYIDRAGGGNPAFIRQLIASWTAETRMNLSFAFNIESPDKANSEQLFPLINYIPRPAEWVSGNEDTRATFEGNNDLNPIYFDKYGFEWNLWKYGGFRFQTTENQTNLDYSQKQTTNIYSSSPTLGFTENTDFCTRIVWSLRRPINAQDAPSVKTFPSTNYFDISDDTGEIKFAWSALSAGKGDNLYALTNSGVCLLPVDKRVVHEINANELATVGSSIGGILNQLWINKNIGMGDETWRSWSEHSNRLFFVNTRAAYMMADNQLNDISRTGFHEILTRSFFDKLASGYASGLRGCYSSLHGEYLMDINGRLVADGPVSTKTLIYGTQQQALQCESSYHYDKYLRVDNRMFGMKDGKTFELGIGNQLNGVNMEASLVGVSNQDVSSDKEFIRIRVNSNVKPEKIYFYDSYDNYVAGTHSSVVDAVATPLRLKDYHGFECYIPRKLLSPHVRQQGRTLIFKITNSSDEDFLINSTSVQYKTLK